MRWAAARGAADVVSVPTDTPFLPLDLVARLDAGRQGLALACAGSRGWAHPVIGLWPVGLADALEAALRGGMRKIDAWTALHGVARVAFEGEPDPFFNANTPDELAEAERLLDGAIDRGAGGPQISAIVQPKGNAP
jgi:molybdopterin-guanine dinucleotide biosynthesis protein A